MKTYKTEIEALKLELKESRENYQIKKKESDLVHADIVNFRRDITRVKTFNKKMMDRERSGGMDFGVIKETWPILESDIHQLEFELKDLETERDHHTAIQDIDRKKMESLLRDYRIENENLRHQVEDTDLVILK